MVKFLSLSSGSNGNCYYIGNERTALLIDAGIGPRTIKKRLAEKGLDLARVELVLVTHDHIDHVKGLAPLAERYNINLLMTAKLYSALLNFRAVGPRIADYATRVETGQEYNYKDFCITPFIVPHDATQTLGYRIVAEGIRIVLITDAGAVTEEILHYGTDVDVLIIEANYNPDMLAAGPYTADLKRRISNGRGHLSNGECGAALQEIIGRSGRPPKHIFLCHLSENNNTPEIALNEVSGALASCGVRVGEEVNLIALPRRSPSDIIVL